MITWLSLSTIYKLHVTECNRMYALRFIVQGKCNEENSSLYILNPYKYSIRLKNRLYLYLSEYANSLTNKLSGMVKDVTKIETSN